MPTTQTRDPSALEEKAPPTTDTGTDALEETSETPARTPSTRLDRPSESEKRNGAMSHFWGKAKEYTSTAANKAKEGVRAVQNTDPAKVGRKTSQAVERSAAETTNFLKSVVSNTTAFGASIAIGLSRGTPIGLSNNQLKKLRMRDGDGELIVVGTRIHTETYEEQQVPKKRVYIEFEEEHGQLCKGIRHEESELPEGMACVPLDMAYETTARDGEMELEVYALPLNDEDGDAQGFLAIDRDHQEVYVYTDA